MGGTGLCLDDVGDSLGLRQVHATVCKGATREFASSSMATARINQRLNDLLLNPCRAMASQFHDILTSK